MTNQEIDPTSDPHDLVTGYLLDSLDALELQRFTDHLDTCSLCQSTIAELSDAVADFASASHVVPPSEVEDRLMASLFGDGSAGPAAKDADEFEQVVTLPTPVSLASRRRWVWPAAAAAAFVLLAALVTTMGLGQSNDDGQLIADGQAQLARAVAEAPDAQSLPMSLSTGQATVVVSAGMNQAAVVATDLPAPPAGQQYHVWTIRGDGTVASAGSFTPDESGSAALMLQTKLADATGFAVTVDDPTLTQPTSAPIAAVNL